MTDITRLLLTCKVPAEPSAKRIAIWRRPKGMGDVYLQNGVCVLARTDDHIHRPKMVENDMNQTTSQKGFFPHFPHVAISRAPSPPLVWADRQRQRAALARPEDRMLNESGVRRAEVAAKALRHD
jgi:hypothetical protein